MSTKLIIIALILDVVQGSLTSSEELNALRNAKAEEIRKYINETADPCENFFEFACGNWKTHYPANANDTRTRAYFMAIDEFDRALSQLLTTTNEADTETELKVKHFYESCLKLASLDLNEYKEKLKGIVSEFGQMPAWVGDKWLEQDFDWLQTVAQIANKYEITIILGYSVEPNDYDHTAYSIVLRCQDFNKIDESEIVQNLEKFLDLQDKEAQETAKDIADFAARLEEAYDNATEANNTESISIENVHQKYLIHFDVKKLFDITYGDSISNDSILDKCTHVPTLAAILKTTPRKTVANYIFYQLLSEFIKNIPEGGTEYNCILQTEGEFAELVSFMFYRSRNLQEREQELERLWQDIKSTLHIILESSRLHWVDDASRENVLEKLHAMRMVVPSYQDFNFTEEYDTLHISPVDYIENLKSLTMFKAAKTRAALKEAPQHIDLNIALSSPVYSFQSNAIIFPVSLLSNDFFWSKAYPQAFNFGHLGYLIGHEVLHGFSAEGRSYNKLGDYFDSRNEVIEQGFAKRRQCLYEQYHQYTFGGHHLPQDEKQAENVADNAGLILTYESYRRWYEDSARSKAELELETLPNLNYTNKQLFFICYAQFWCADTYEDERVKIATADDHVPDEFRAFVPLTNFEEFSKAFECPKGSGMNPVEKCKIY